MRRVVSLPCGHDVLTRTDTVPACSVCEPFIPTPSAPVTHLARTTGTRTVGSKRTPRLTHTVPADARQASESTMFLRSDGRKRPSQRAALVIAETAQADVQRSLGLVAKGESPMAYRRAEAQLSHAATAWLKSAKSRKLGPVNGAKSSVAARYSGTTYADRPQVHGTAVGTTATVPARKR